MSQNNDIYAIVGRIKNLLAKEDIALSPVGTVLVNYYALALKEFYDYSEKLPQEYKEGFQRLLLSREDVPKNIILVSSPQEESETLYEKILKMKPQFETNEEALNQFSKEYKNLTESYGLKDDEFWFEAESSSNLTEDHQEIMSLAGSIRMCKYLINKNKEYQDDLTGDGEEHA
jgi:hypothetical protein